MHAGHQRERGVRPFCGVSLPRSGSDLECSLSHAGGSNARASHGGGRARPARGSREGRRAIQWLLHSERTNDAMRGLTKFARLALPSAILVFFCIPGAAAQGNAIAASMDSASAGPAPHTNAAGETPQPDLPRRNERYQLCASDVIALTFPLTPEFDQTVNIQPDGFASLAGTGGVHLEGLTVEEAAEAVRTAYVKVLHDPIVTIELKDFNKPYFVVNGQVNKPGKYDLRGYTSATQAIAIAGGFNDSAKHSQVLLFRRVNDGWYEVKLLNLKRILQGRDVNEDAEIRTGDMLFVPQNFISKIKRYIPSTGIGTYYEMYR
jgi:polysaccharide biosynthesis/export protein